MNDTQPGEVLNNLTPAEWIITAGAAWILFVDFFIGNRIQEEYFATVLIVAAPLSLVLLLAVIVRNGAESAWNGLYPGTVNAAGIVIIVFTVMDLFNGLTNEFSQSGEFYEITFYIAVAVIAVGLFQLRQQAASGEVTSF